MVRSLRLLFAMKCDEWLSSHILLGLFHSMSSSCANWIRVGLFLKDSRKLLGEVSILQAGCSILEWTRQHLFALIGGLIESNLKNTIRS